MNLEEIRKNIDHIDREIMRLLNERLEFGLRSKKFKDSIYDEKRERQVLSQLRRILHAHNLIQPDFLERLFAVILGEGRKIQEADRKLIGFQGEHGAFGEEAARNYHSELVAIPCAEFADVFEGVEQGNFDMGIVPVENSLAGAITQVNELLIQSKLKVVGAIRLQVNHCLLAPPDSNYRDIRIVYSHPQALAQCREFINRHNLEARPFYDTAGAARMLSENKPRMAAAIAGRLCADLFGLEVIKENIQDHPNNFTRFLILAKEEQKKYAEKCSIVFSTPHKAGTLFAVLRIFAEDGINLTRIESLPSRDDPGNYVFFLDFQCADLEPEVERILEKVRSSTAGFRFLGCYKEEVFG
jgi:prephenate dehydratase/chorismate mutase